MTSQVKNSYASVVKFGGGAGAGKRVLWRQKRQDHTLVVFDTVEKWPLEAAGVASSSESGKGEVIAAVVRKGGPRPPVKKRRPFSFPEHLGIVDGKPWEKMGLSQGTWQERMDNAQCLKCGTAGHGIAWCLLIQGNEFPHRPFMIPPDMDGVYEVDRIIEHGYFSTGGRGRPQKQFKIVENCEEKLTEDMVEKLINTIDETLPPPPMKEGAEDDEEEEDGGGEEAEGAGKT
ncbi:hypothetical protein CBR_g19681 [Chara braunii]|uniref:Uncharacterized protein n=1 Tax=Chara braunii TaxID=69332 RepID=A0A388KYS1_CHABU|nr:hypothetical protein CBR_g19681 [Chara braunii]|eukprot:GBG75168.1 hypothetical protein CBR_g19681 [Chara braunii]